MTDNHVFLEIVNWKWVATDGVGLLFLCLSLQTSDPTIVSEYREEARTRMADRGLVRMICVGSLKYASEEEEEEEEEEEKEKKKQEEENCGWGREEGGGGEEYNKEENKQDEQ